MRIHRDLDQLPTWRNPVVTIGSFDGVHNGHRTILAQMRKKAQSVQGETILITFEPHPRLVLEAKENAPPFQLLNTLPEKIALLAATGIDHLVIVDFDKKFSNLSAEAYLQDFLFDKFRPHTIFIGYDHRFGNDRSGGLATLRTYALQHAPTTEIIEIPAQEVDEVIVSSTKVRNAVLTGDMEYATQMLKTPYVLSGTVMLGDQIGRTLQYPTANLSTPNPHKLLPPDGVYACTTVVCNKTYTGMLYLGNRPTIAGKLEHRIEVNILDFDQDIYGEPIKISVEKRIRGDLKLESIDALQTQIHADKLAILAYEKQSTAAVDVAIVILNYNTAGHLATFLPSVIKYSAGARIIVADNGSPDHSIAFVREHFPEIQILDLKVNSGFAGGYNHALKQVDAKYYVILNSDVEVTEHWLQAPLQLLEKDATVAIVQPKIKAYRQKSHFEYAGAAGGYLDILGYPFCRGRIFSNTEADGGQYDTEKECFWAAGAAFFIRAHLYHAFDGFDADYFAHNEEIDLCWRIKRAGYHVICTPTSVVYHLGGGTLEYESPRKVFLNFRNSLFTLLKNAKPGHLAWVIPLRLVLDGIAGIRFLFKGQFRAILAIVQAHFSFYSQFSHTLDKRKEQQARVEKERIGPENLTGMIQTSMVWQFYAKRKKVFGQ